MSAFLFAVVWRVQNASNGSGTEQCILWQRMARNTFDFQKPAIEFEEFGNFRQIRMIAMLFEHANERRFVHEPWSRQNELMAESEDLDAARGLEAFLGFSDDDDANPSVFIRAKILYEPGPKTQICNLDDSHSQLAMHDSQGQRDSEFR